MDTSRTIIGIGIGIGFKHYNKGKPVIITGSLLLENGDDILLENGNLILVEFETINIE